MKKELAVKRNLDLLNEFMKYAFDNPEVMDKMPMRSKPKSIKDAVRPGTND